MNKENKRADFPNTVASFAVPYLNYGGFWIQIVVTEKGRVSF